MYGRISLPLLAIVADSMASCSGVTVSSFWPMADMAAKDNAGSSGNLLATTGRGMVRFGSLNPHASPLLLISLVLLCGRVRLVGASTSVLGEALPWLNRAELVTILNVDPGG